MAGESAGAYGRRQREKAERLIRAAERWERGAAGEAETATHLEALRAQGWVVFHDVRWPGRPRANIDHIAVGPGGVFVIDSKNWAGSIAVRDDVLVQNGRRRESAVVGAGEAALAITGILGNLPATGVLCFVRDEAVAGWARDVMVCSTSTLADMLTSRPQVLHPSAVARVAGQLSSRLSSASEPARGVQSIRRPDRTVPVRSTPTMGRDAKKGGSRLARRLLILGLVGIALMVMVSLVVALVTSTTKGALETLTGAKSELGKTISVDGNDARPALAISALRVRPTRVGPRVFRAQPGNRLVAVDLRLKNQGDQAWNLSATSLVIVDKNGLRYHPAALQRDVPGVLSSAAIVGPARDVKGLILFEVPRRAAVAEVTMSVGPGLPRRLRWHVPG